MGNSLSVKNDSNSGCNVSVHTVGRGFEVKSFTVKPGEKVDERFPEAVWYDIKFVVDGRENWQAGVYGGSPRNFRVTFQDNIVYVNG